MNKESKLTQLRKEYGEEYEKYKLETLLRQGKKLEDVIVRLSYVKAETQYKAFQAWDNSGDFYLTFEKWLAVYKNIEVEKEPTNLIEILD